MLWIDLLGLSRAHAEGGSVEAPHIVDYAGGERIAAADLIRRRVIVCLGREAVGRDLGHGAKVVAQEFPKTVTVPRAGKTAGITDNRYFVPTRHAKARSPTRPHDVIDPAQTIKFVLPGSITPTLP